VDPKVGFYSEKIFNIENIKKLDKIMELGRSCVHKDYRDKPIISLLWKGIAGYIQENDIRYLFGSTRLYTCQPRQVNECFNFIKNKYYAPDKYRVWPLKENVFDALDDTPMPSQGEKIFQQLPPLLKGYLKLGMKICSEPAWDLHLKSIVFFILLDIDTMTDSYKRHFFSH
jgi:putative hemolysin